MKRFVAILLILVLVFALSATAFAASNVCLLGQGFGL